MCDGFFYACSDGLNAFSSCIIGDGGFWASASTCLVNGGVSEGRLRVPMKQPTGHHRLSVKSRSSQKSDSVDTLTTVTSSSQHTGKYSKSNQYELARDHVIKFNGQKLSIFVNSSFAFCEKLSDGFTLKETENLLKSLILIYRLSK